MYLFVSDLGGHTVSIILIIILRSSILFISCRVRLVANVRPGIVEVRGFRGYRGAGTVAKSPALVFDRYLSGLIEFGNLLAPSVRAVRRSMAAVRNTLLTFLFSLLLSNFTFVKFLNRDA